MYSLLVKFLIYINMYEVMGVFGFVFMFRVLFDLLKTLLLPHTRVCGHCGGGFFDFIFCRGVSVVFSFLSNAITWKGLEGLPVWLSSRF